MLTTEVAEHSQKHEAGEFRFTNSSGQPQNAGNRESQRAWDGKSLTIAVATAGVLLAIYLLRLDKVVGLFKDDGWYVVLAKSLASGHGYNMINLPQHSGLYFYPPLFPLLLSLLYRLSPEFPANVWLLKSLSIASMMAAGFLVFQLFNRHDRLPRFLAYLVAFATVAAPPFVFLATSSVMSECFFSALCFATLLALERWQLEQQEAPDWRKVIIVAVLTSACYLTRTIGIALVATVVVTFFARRRFKALCLFAVTIAFCVAPWNLYKHFFALRSSGPSVVAETYSAQFWDRRASSKAKITVRDLPGRVWQLSTVIAGDDVGGTLIPSLYRSPCESGKEVIDMTSVIPRISGNAIGESPGSMGLAPAGQIISACFALLLLIGSFRAAKHGLRCSELFCGLSLILIVLWPWNPMRFLVPLLPFFLYFLVLGIGAVHKFIVRNVGSLSISDPWRASRIAIVCILGFFVYDNAMYIVAKHKNPETLQYPKWLRDFNSFQQAASWVRDHTADNEVITSDNLPATYLYTQRKTAMCELDECAQVGVRYYLGTEGLDLSIPTRVAFATASYNIQVLDISNPR